jgi:aminodeoxyfutalosine synthase
MEGMSVSSLEEAQQLLASRDLIAIGARADEERQRRHGTRTTFVRVFEVHVDAIPGALPSSAEPGEIRIVGRPQSIDGAIDAVARVRAIAGTTPLTAFSLADMVDLAGARLREFCASLRAAGLETISEAPVDLLPDAAAVIRTAHGAGLTVPRVTVNAALAGSAGSTGNAGSKGPAYLVTKVNALQAEVGGIRAFAPLPRTSSSAHPSTGYDDVKVIATARLVAEKIESIQVDWALYGPKLAQVALTMGADDVDSVSPLQGDLGRRRSPIEEIRGNIRAAGLEPIERDGHYRVRT